jgi:hypothetical protein
MSSSRKASNCAAPQDLLSISGLCPSSEILNLRKHNVSEIGYVSVLR